MKWSDVLGKQSETRYGPASFQELLRSTFVDPYDSEIIPTFDFPKLITVLHNMGYFETDEWTSIGDVVELQRDEDERKEIADIFGETDKDVVETISFIIALYILAIHENGSLDNGDAKMTSEEAEEIQKRFNDNNLSIGAQHAFWYMYHEGPNTEIGEKMKAIAEVHVSDVYAQ